MAEWKWNGDYMKPRNEFRSGEWFTTHIEGFDAPAKLRIHIMEGGGIIGIRTFKGLRYTYMPQYTRFDWEEIPDAPWEMIGEPYKMESQKRFTPDEHARIDAAVLAVVRDSSALAVKAVEDGRYPTIPNWAYLSVSATTNDLFNSRGGIWFPKPQSDAVKALNYGGVKKQNQVVRGSLTRLVAADELAKIMSVDDFTGREGLAYFDPAIMGHEGIED